MKPEKDTSRVLTRNYVVVALVWLILVASIIMMPQRNLYNGLLPSAYAQQAEEEAEHSEQDQQEALVSLQALSAVASVTDLEGLLVDLVQVTDTEGLADVVGASDSSELTEMPRVTASGLANLIEVTNLQELLELVGVPDLEELVDLLDPQASPTDPPTEGEQEED
jgi:hypothetical protein